MGLAEIAAHLFLMSALTDACIQSCLPKANKSIATRVVAQINEEQKWKDLLATQDVRVRFEVLRYRQERRQTERSALSSLAKAAVSCP